MNTCAICLACQDNVKPGTFKLILCDSFAVALAFQAQLVESVPTAPHDIDIDILVTATETEACSARGEQAIAASAIP